MAAMLLVPGRAEACGGTFCDGAVPGPMPVDQTGENVIFVMGGAEAEVHIQISYDPNTNADKFAWMIPLASVPSWCVSSPRAGMSMVCASENASAAELRMRRLRIGCGRSWSGMRLRGRKRTGESG